MSTTDTQSMDWKCMNTYPDMTNLVHTTHTREANAQKSIDLAFSLQALVMFFENLQTTTETDLVFFSSVLDLFNECQMP